MHLKRNNEYAACGMDDRNRTTTCPSLVRNSSTANTPAPSKELTALYATSVAHFLIFHGTSAGALTI